jgi:glycosyltransferase 2 family protein
MSSGRNRTILIAVGTLLGAFFLYLAFRDISWPELVHGVSQMKPIYFIPCTIMVLMIQFLRAVRFGVILSPLCRLGMKDLWDLLNIWAAAGMIMPARLGELVRPYLLQRRNVSFSSTVGAVLVERFFDLSGLLLLLATVLWYSPQVPPIYSLVGQILLGCLMIGYIVVLVMLAYRERVNAFLSWGLSWLPERAHGFLHGILVRLIDGFGIMANFRQALVIFVCSVLIWVLFSVLTYLFLAAFSVQAPFLVAVTIQVFICFGVALPSAPGFIGTFHAACRYALTLFGIPSVVAVSFATVYHLFSLVLCLVLGFVSYRTSDYHLDPAMLDESIEHETAAEGETTAPLPAATLSCSGEMESPVSGKRS